MTSQSNQYAAFESLESRTLLAAVPSISQSTGNLGLQLNINGTAGNDQILISQSSKGITVSNGAGWTKTYSGNFRKLVVHGNAGNDVITLNPSVTADAMIYGDAGNDTLTGGAGNDQIFGGAGANQLFAGAGNDVLVSIGGSNQDRLHGGAGNDNFWMDADTTEKVLDANGKVLSSANVHRVGSFLSYRFARSNRVATYAVSKELNGPALMDPTATTASIGYKNFKSRPLFATSGPSADDVIQGYVGDCYFLATISSIAKTDANLIRQSVVDLGDGTYAVQFATGRQKVFVRVDADLPTWSWGSLAYANSGRENSIWVAVMEKAFTFFRRQAGTYASISNGMMSEVYADFGKSSTTIWDASSGTSLLQQILDELNAGQSVTFAVGGDTGGGAVVNYHAYTVDRVNVDSSGKPVSLRLRNPWGVDGAGNDGSNDGYVTLTANQAAAAFMAVTSAAV